MEHTKQGSGLLPNQAVPLSKKLSKTGKPTKWAIACIDAIANSQPGVESRQSKRDRLIENYKMFNNDIVETDLDYVRNPTRDGKRRESPARIRSYNIITPKIQVVLGEQKAMPLKWTTKAVGGQFVSEFQEARKSKIVQHLVDTVYKPMMEGQDVDINQVLQSSKQLMEYMSGEYRDGREVLAQHILDYYLERTDFKSKRETAFLHGWLSGEMIFYVGMRGDDVPEIRVVNPVYFGAPQYSHTNRIEDGDWAWEIRYMSPSEVVDYYGEEMTSEQVSHWSDYTSFGTTGEAGFFHTDLGGPNLDTNDNSAYEYTHSVEVTTCTWKTMKRLRLLEGVDEQGMEVSEWVDDTFDLLDEMKEAGYDFVKTRWVSEVWEGTRIGNRDYVRVGPIANQMRNADNLSDCKLPYVGRRLNALNDKAVSPFEMVKPLQILHNIIWFKIEEEINKSKGKAVEVDIANIDMKMEDYMYYLHNLNVSFVNSAKKRADNDYNPGGRTAAKEIDMGLSNSVAQMLSAAQQINQHVANMLGVSRQRQGAIHQEETAQGVTRAISQSAYVTRYTFTELDSVTKSALNQFMELCKWAAKDGQSVVNVLNDVQRSIVQIDPDFLQDSDYGVFITSDSSEFEKQQNLQQLAGVALQQQVISFEDMVRLAKADGVAEMKQIMEESVARTRQEQQEARQQEAEQQQKLIEQQQQLKQLEMENENMNKEADRQLKRDLMQAEITKEIDVNNNGVPDGADYLKKDTENRKLELEKSKQDIDRQLQEKKMKLEEKKMETQLKIAKENKNRYDSPRQT